MGEVHTSKKRRFLRPSIIAFIMPVVILSVLYIIRGVFPFGDKIYVRMDFYHQYAPFMREFCRHILNGESLLYDWDFGLGTNYWAHYAYYLASPLNWLLIWIPGDYIIEAMNFLLVLRAGIAGSAFVFFLKENRRENMAMAVFGAFYALSGYYLAYSGNVIWMDGYALFPLVALGIKRIAKGKSTTLYTVSMLICTFSNFYLAVIMGMCCVLWLIICLINERRQTFKAVCLAIGRFTLSTLLYVGMCAVILLPVASALMNTPAGDSSFPEKTEFYFAFYDMFERMCVNVPSNLKGSDLPNLYASVFALVLLPMYFGNKSIRLKNKIVNGFVLLFMLASFEINMLDYIWHGLHFPNSFPARQSFFFIFLVLVLGYEAFAKRKRVSLKVICISVPLLMAAAGAAWIFLGKDNDFNGIHIYLCTILFMLAYGILFIMERKISAKPAFIILLVMCCVEVSVNTWVVGIDSVVSRASYMEDNAETLAALNEIMPEEGFYRVEEQDRNTVNDAAWDGYYGASYFSSTMPGGVKEWYDAFGMRNSSVSYSYDGATPLITSLLGIRYVFASEDAYKPGNTFIETDICLEDESIKVYENTTALPLGYMVKSDLEKEFNYNFSNPFITLNDYAGAVLGEDTDLFEPVKQYKEIEVLQFDTSAGAEAELEESEYEKKKVSVEIPAGENVFLYVYTYLEAIEVEVRNEKTGEVETREYDDLKFKKIISIGVEAYDRVIIVSSADAGVSEVKFYSYEMNESVLKRIYDKLNQNPMELTNLSGTEISGKIDVKEAGVLLLSIPYDAGWTVYANGEEMPCFAWKEAFLALELEEGSYELEFVYCPVGFKKGLVISLVSLTLALLVMGSKIYAKNKKTKIGMVA